MAAQQQRNIPKIEDFLLVGPFDTFPDIGGLHGHVVHRDLQVCVRHFLERLLGALVGLDAVAQRPVRRAALGLILGALRFHALLLAGQCADQAVHVHVVQVFRGKPHRLFAHGLGDRRVQVDRPRLLGVLHPAGQHLRRSPGGGKHRLRVLVPGDKVNGYALPQGIQVVDQRQQGFVVAVLAHHIAA